VDERRVRIGSLFEWLVAAAGVVLLVWLIAVPVQRALGPGVEASLVDVAPGNPPGVPAGASNVPVMLLGGGREIRHGDLFSRVSAFLPERLAEGPAHLSPGEFGDRMTRAYAVDGAKFYVVWERTEPSGPMRISGIYLP
jgi:hypothetical protein